MSFADVQRKPLSADDILATPGSERERGRDAIEYLRSLMETRMRQPNVEQGERPQLIPPGPRTWGI